MFLLAFTNAFLKNEEELFLLRVDCQIGNQCRWDRTKSTSRLLTPPLAMLNFVNSPLVLCPCPVISFDLNIIVILVSRELFSSQIFCQVQTDYRQTESDAYEPTVQNAQVCSKIAHLPCMQNQTKSNKRLSILLSHPV